MPLTVGNPGTDTSESFVGALDVMLIYESAGLPSVTQLGGWHANHAPSNFGVIPHAAQFDAAFVRNARQYVQYIYVQNDTLPNPWDSVPASFGGPNLGVFAAKNELVRRMPGRLVGATVDRDGKRGFVLTLQTREQHIRRAKATSNICTNVALCALMATIYLATLGKQGLRRVGELSTAKAHYAAERLTAIPGVSLRFTQPFFKEFVLRLPKSPATVVARLARRRILPGVPLRTYDRTLADSLLVAVTEQRTREEIDAYAGALAEVLK